MTHGTLPIFHIELVNPTAVDTNSFGYVLSAVLADRDIVTNEELMFAYNYESGYNAGQLSMLVPPQPETPPSPSRKQKKRMSLDDLSSKVLKVGLNHASESWEAAAAFPTVMDLDP